MQWRCVHIYSTCHTFVLSHTAFTQSCAYMYTHKIYFCAKLLQMNLYQYKKAVNIGRLVSHALTWGMEKPGRGWRSVHTPGPATRSPHHTPLYSWPFSSLTNPINKGLLLLLLLHQPYYTRKKMRLTDSVLIVVKQFNTDWYYLQWNADPRWCTPTHNHVISKSLCCCNSRDKITTKLKNYP